MKKRRKNEGRAKKTAVWGISIFFLVTLLNSCSPRRSYTDLEYNKQATQEKMKQEKRINELINKLRQDYRWEQMDSITRQFREIGSSAIPPLIKELRSADGHYGYRVIEAISNMGDDGIFALIKELENQQNPWLGDIAEKLGEIRESRALEALIVSLNDTSIYWEDRRLIATAIGKIGEKRAVPKLIEFVNRNINRSVDKDHLEFDESGIILQDVISALIELKDTRAIPALEQVADKDLNPDVREKARYAIFRLKELIDLEK